MPKRKRSQFEPIPTEGRSNPGQGHGAGDRSAFQAWRRWNRRAVRLNRLLDRQIPAEHMFNDASMYWNLAERVRSQLIWRSFGLTEGWDFDRGIRGFDREEFFEYTGRLSYVVKSWRRSIDRRRREAYIRLRSWLPMEVVRRILELTPSWNALN